MNYRYQPDSKPLPGYTIKRGVGRGAFGEVYYAVSDGGKEVALKLVQNQIEVELRGVRECLNLDHANLVRLYDVQENDDGEAWVVMEYCDGESLEEAIARYPDGMPVDIAMQWMRGICAAVAYLHDQDIVHRDLKPSHAFMENGVVKIGDYGLAKYVTMSRRSGNTEGIGTVYYAAPEMAEGRYGKEIDQYALGVMFYEMLSGDVPFEGETAAEVLMKHLTAKPDVARFPSPYKEVLGRLLEKKPERRFKSVEQLVAALDKPLSAAGFVMPPLPGKDWMKSKLARAKDACGPKNLFGRVFGFVRNNKLATAVFIGMTIAAFAIGAAVMEDAWRAHYYRYGPHRNPTYVSVQSLSDLRVKRGDGKGSVRLSEVASYTAPRSVQRLAPRRPVYEVMLNKEAADRFKIGRMDILEAVWDAGYSLVIDFEMRDGQSNGIDRSDVYKAITRLRDANNTRKRHCRVMRYNDHTALQVTRDRYNRIKQRGITFDLMNLQDLFNVDIEKNGKSTPIGDVVHIRLLVTNPF